MNKVIPVLTVAVLLSNPLMAAQDNMASAWKGSAELGYVATTGNTETSTVNAKGKVSTEVEKWRHAVEISILNSADTGSTTAERYILTGQSDYKFSKTNYAFGIINYENDRFSGFDYQITEAIGYGRRIIDQPNLTMGLEVGPGARQSKLNDKTTSNETVLRGAAKINWAINDNSKFDETLTIESSSDSTISKSISSLTTQVAGDLAMKVSYTIKNTSDVPVGAASTDTETAVTLVYSF